MKYYAPLFSKEEYKEIFDINKKSVKDLLLGFINKVYKIKQYDYNNKDLEDLVAESNINFPNFNQPLEFDSPNNELK